jgi:hypothetical protein
MRLSWAQGAVAALVVVVAAGMLEVPSRILGPARAVQAPLALPRTVTPAVVLANPPAARPPAIVRVSAPRAKPKPARTPAVTKIPAEPVAPRTPPRRARPSPGTSAPPLVVTLGRARHLPLPPDPARPPAAPTPAPPPAPAPAPPVPAAAPAVPPSTTPTETIPSSTPATSDVCEHEKRPAGRAANHCPPLPSDSSDTCDGEVRPGNGNGDDNHCHTGAPGKDGERHGSGHH